MLVCGSHVDDTLTELEGSLAVIDNILDEFHGHLKIEKLGKLKKHLLVEYFEVRESWSSSRWNHGHFVYVHFVLTYFLELGPLVVSFTDL